MQTLTSPSPLPQRSGNIYHEVLIKISFSCWTTFLNKSIYLFFFFTEIIIQTLHYLELQALYVG